MLDCLSAVQRNLRPVRFSMAGQAATGRQRSLVRVCETLRKQQRTVALLQLCHADGPYRNLHYPDIDEQKQAA
jgi:hypothetical protein